MSSAALVLPLSQLFFFSIGWIFLNQKLFGEDRTGRIKNDGRLKSQLEQDTHRDEDLDTNSASSFEKTFVIKDLSNALRLIKSFLSLKWNRVPYQTISYILFALTFSLSCTLFELVIFELAGIFDQRIRKSYWRLNLSALLALVVIILPYYQIHLYFSSTSSSPSKFRDGLKFLIYAVYLWIFWKLGHWFPLSKQQEDPHNVSLFHSEYYLGRVGVLGVTLIAALSGLTSIHSPYSFLSHALFPTSLDDIQVQERRISNFIEVIFSKKRRIRSLINSSPSFNQGVSAQAVRGLFGWIRSGFSSSGMSGPDIESLKLEIQTYETLLSQSFQELDELNSNYRRQTLSTTWKGRYENLIGVILTIYGVYKLLITAWHVILPSSITGSGDRVNSDPVEKLIGRVISLGLLRPTDCQRDCQQFISFILVGIMIAISLRGLLLYLMRVFRYRRFSKTSFFQASQIGTNSNTYSRDKSSPNSGRLPSYSFLPLLTYLTATHILSTLVLLTSWTSRASKASSNTDHMNAKNDTSSPLLPPLAFPFHKWFDLIFLAFAIVGIVVIYWSVVGRMEMMSEIRSNVNPSIPSITNDEYPSQPIKPKSFGNF